MRRILGLATVLVATVTDTSAADPVRVTTDGSFKQHLQWHPDGTSLLFTRIHQGRMALWTVGTEGKDLRRLLPDHKEPHFDGHYSTDGKCVVYVYDKLEGTDGKLSIRSCATDGTDDKVLIPHKAFEESPRFSPDGKLVLWVSTRHGNPELYTVTTDGKDEKRLTSEVTSDLHPCWSPDGKRIVFTSGRTGRQKVYVMNADGSGVNRLTEGDHLDSWPVWRPDGKKLAFVSRKSGNADVWVMDADGNNPVNLTATDGEDTTPAWSPDGKKLAIVSARDGGSDIYVIEVK